MVNYQKLYTMLFDAATDVLEALEELNVGRAKDILRQAQIDAEKASYVKATSAALSNKGLTWNEQYSRYEIKMYPGETRKLKYTPVPVNVSDTNLYWYCGNMPTFNPIGQDQVLTVPTTTATGRVLVYEARNRERETICRSRVDVVAQGNESDPDEDDPDIAELLGGKLPCIAGYTSGGKTVPALVLEDGVLSASVAGTVSGVYYTAFTSATLDRKTFTAKKSLPGTGEPIQFALDVGDAPSQYLIVVASSAPIVVGAPLE